MAANSLLAESVVIYTGEAAGATEDVPGRWSFATADRLAALVAGYSERYRQESRRVFTGFLEGPEKIGVGAQQVFLAFFRTEHDVLHVPVRMKRAFRRTELMGFEQGSDKSGIEIQSMLAVDFFYQGRHR